MSMYDDYESDELFDYIRNFLKGHPVHQLLEIVKDAVREIEDD